MKKIVIVLFILVIAGVLWWANRPQPDMNIPTAQVSEVDSNTNLNTNTDNKIPANQDTSESVDPVVVAGKNVDNQNVKISFKGFGPGKSHIGGFGAINSQLVSKDGVISGQVNIDMNTLQAPDSKKLEDHLKSKDFFDVVAYPQASFNITSMDTTSVTGVMNLHGVSKVIKFPVNYENSTYSSKFNINMKDFGIDQKFANEIIELTVIVPVK